MKKSLFFVLSFFIFVLNINAFEVKFSECVDGDTAKFKYNGEVITARFLAIDTPETKHPTNGEEPMGKEASKYTCEKLKNASKIVLEYDDDSDKLDKYERHLVWVFIDGELLQKELVRNGYAAVAYLYGDYKYTDILETEEQKAEDEKLGIWNINNTGNEKAEEKKDKVEKNETKSADDSTNNINLKQDIIFLGIIILLCIINRNAKSKVVKKATKKVKNDLKKIRNK